VSRTLSAEKTIRVLFHSPLVTRADVRLPIAESSMCSMLARIWLHPGDGLWAVRLKHAPVVPGFPRESIVAAWLCGRKFG
jgi:hypothetical protein